MTPKKIIMATLLVIGLIAGVVLTISPEIVGIVGFHFPESIIFIYAAPTALLFWVGIYAAIIWIKTRRRIAPQNIYQFIALIILYLLALYIGLIISMFIAIYQIFKKD